MIWIWQAMLACVFIAPADEEPAPAAQAPPPGGFCVADPIPDDLVPLTAENVDQLALVGTLCQPSDRGSILAMALVGEELATAGERAGVQLWNPERAQVRTMAFGAPVHSVSWVEPREMLLLGTGEGEVFGVSLAGKRLWQARGRHEGSANAAIVRLDQGDVISGGEDGWVRRWSLETGTLLADRNIGSAVADQVALGKESVVVCGAELLTHALQAETLQPGRSWARERDTSWALAVRPFAEHLAIGGSRVTVWEGDLETRFQHPIEGSARSMAYDPAGDLLAVGTWGGQLLIFDVAARTLLALRKPNESRVLATTFAPHGRWVATAGDGGMVRIWGVRRSELEAE